MIWAILKIGLFWWFWLEIAQNPEFPNQYAEAAFWGMMIVMHIIWIGRATHD